MPSINLVREFQRP